MINSSNTINLTPCVTLQDFLRGMTLSENENDPLVDSTAKSTFSLKAIQQMELNPYHSESDKCIEWYESTAQSFGTATVEQLLHDEALCEEHKNISFAAKCIVVRSLEEGSAA